MTQMPPHPQQQAPSGYPAQGYPQTMQQPTFKPPTNVFAIVGLVGVFFFGLVGIIFGHLALSQIKRTGEGGRGLALAAVIIGYVRILGDLFGIIALLIFAGAFGVGVAVNM